LAFVGGRGVKADEHARGRFRIPRSPEQVAPSPAGREVGALIASGGLIEMNVGRIQYGL
jgi:hypothetical protein